MWRSRWHTDLSQVCCHLKAVLSPLVTKSRAYQRCFPLIAVPGLVMKDLSQLINSEVPMPKVLAERWEKRWESAVLHHKSSMWGPAGVQDLFWLDFFSPSLYCCSRFLSSRLSANIVEPKLLPRLVKLGSSMKLETQVKCKQHINRPPQHSAACRSTCASLIFLC